LTVTAVFAKSRLDASDTNEREPDSDRSKKFADFSENQGDATLKMAIRKPFVLFCVVVGLRVAALSAACGLSPAFGLIGVATPVVYSGIGGAMKLAAYGIRKLNGIRKLEGQKGRRREGTPGRQRAAPRPGGTPIRNRQGA
jgi:hypothetical protein